MKQKIISALFLSGTMLVSNFAFAESVPETATTTTVTESVAAATEESEPTTIVFTTNYSSIFYKQ